MSAGRWHELTTTWISSETEEKERHFGGILRYQMRMAKSASSWSTLPYLYADLHAGPGRLSFNGRYFLGSPLIFLNAAVSIGLGYEALFFEQDIETADLLRQATCGRGEVFEESCESGMSRWLAEKGFQRSRYGLIYSDPIGKEIPVALLQAAARTLPRVDLLSYTSGTAYKRVGSKRLSDDINAIPKTCKLIREPAGAWQWTFILWSNWDDFPAWHKIGFVRLDSDRGQDILMRLDLTRRELEEKVNGHLPLGLDPIKPTPNTSGIQSSALSEQRLSVGPKDDVSIVGNNPELRSTISGTPLGESST